MKRPFRLALWTAALLLATAAIAGLGWYQADRTGMLAALCEAGLPNFSRPETVDAESLGCAILGPPRRVRGVLLTAFETSNLIETDLGPPPANSGFNGNTWYTCNQNSGCAGVLDRQLAQPLPGLCGIGMASIVVDGWPTVSSGNFGHLGAYSRELFVDQVIQVGPPPAAQFDRLRREWAQAGIGQCP